MIDCGRRPVCAWSHRRSDALEQAWGIIANASDWDREDRAEWRQAAEHFRDWTYPGGRQPRLTRILRRRKMERGLSE